MIGEDNGQPIIYKLDMSEAVALEVKKLIHNADDETLRRQVIRALKIIFARVRADPLQFGEIVRSHQSLNLLVHAAVVHPVAVHFAINPEKRFVLIQRVFLLT